MDTLPQSDPLHNDETFFLIERTWIHQKIWARMSKIEKAILPVILMHIDADGVSHPGQRTIAGLSGVTDRAVRTGLKQLGKKGLAIKKKKADCGYRYNEYHLKLSIANPLRFYKSIIHDGTWGNLSLNAKAVYPVARHFCYEFYADKHFGLCQESFARLAEYAGISRRRIRSAILELHNHCLIFAANETPYRNIQPLTVWEKQIQIPKSNIAIPSGR